MKSLTRSAAAIVLLAAVVPGARAADITDPADLFPPGTLAYAELHDPATIGPQLATVFKGTALEDSIPFIHGRRDTTKDPRDLSGKDQLALLGLLASSEMAGEFKKLRGIAVGVTGFTEQGDPQAAVAVLTGDSAAGLVMRALLTMTSVRKVGAVGDVPIYQFRQPIINYENGRPTLQNDKLPTEGLYEATFAYVPGLIVIGTGKAAIAEVVTRFQGKAKGSLSGTPAFKDAATAHRKPGLFFYANAAEFCAKYDEARRKSDGPVEPDALGWFRLLANTKAVRYVAGCARFRDGGLSLTLGGAFDPAVKSPLVVFLSGSGAKVELLRGAPSPATFAVVVALPEKERARAVIDLLDAVAKANGELGRLPGDAIKELEAKYKVSIADALIGKTRAVVVVLPVKQELPKGARAMPQLVLHTDGPDVAAAWEEFLPKLIGDLGGAAPPQPSSEIINGIKVLSLAGAALPWKAAVHYARKDGTFVVGLDRKLVAGAIAGEATSPAVAVPPGDAPVLLGTISLGGLVHAMTETTRPAGPVVPLGPVAPATTVPGRRGYIEDFGGPSGGPATPEEQKKDEAKVWDALLKAVDGLPAATVTAQRAGNELRFEVWQPKVQGGGLAPVVTAGIGWFDKVLNRNANPNSPGYPQFGRFR